MSWKQLVSACVMIQLSGLSALAESGMPPEYLPGSEFKVGMYPGAVLMPVQLWGAAGKAGHYQLPVRTDLATFLSYTGGPAKDAKLDEITIKRTSKGKGEVIKVNLEQFLERPDTRGPVLEPNDVVVTDGGDRLREGAQVELPDTTAAEVAKARAQAQAERKNQPRFPGFRKRKGELRFRRFAMLSCDDNVRPLRPAQKPGRTPKVP